MRVRVTKTHAGNEADGRPWCRRAGAELELPAAEARGLARAGLVELIEKPATKPTAKRRRTRKKAAS